MDGAQVCFPFESVIKAVRIIPKILLFPRPGAANPWGCKILGQGLDFVLRARPPEWVGSTGLLDLLKALWKDYPIQCRAGGLSCKIRIDINEVAWSCYHGTEQK
jgi:hypothetical protein